MTQHSQLDPRTWQSSAPWSLTSWELCPAYHESFGHDLYSRLLEVAPHLAASAQFFTLATQPDDTWIIFTYKQSAFGVQIDPAIHVIVVFDVQSQAEFGSWLDDPITQSIQFIAERYLR